MPIQFDSYTVETGRAGRTHIKRFRKLSAALNRYGWAVGSRCFAMVALHGHTLTETHQLTHWSAIPRIAA